MFQCDKHILHYALGSVTSNSHNSMFPTSRINGFDFGLMGLDDWFCRRSCWKGCQFGWFSIFWINCRTRVTTECGSPGILKSMSASFTIVNSWFSSWTTMDFSILSRRTSSLTLSVSALWYSRKSLCIAAVSTTNRLVLSWSLLNIETQHWNSCSLQMNVFEFHVRTGRPLKNWVLRSKN